MAQLINTKNTHTNTNTNTQGVLIDNNMLSIPSDVIEVIIEFLKYDSISNFYESLGKDSKTNIITFLSRKYEIMDNNKYFSKNKINDQLFTAAHFGHLNILSMLLDVEGIDVNQVDKKGFTPLCMAAKKHHNDIVLALMEVEGIIIDGEVIATYCQFGDDFIEGLWTKPEMDWDKQKTMAKMLLKARGWILYEWVADEALRNLIKDTDIFIMNDRKYVSCKTDIILEATCEALRKEIKASAKYWIKEEHEISHRDWLQDLYEIDELCNEYSTDLRWDPNNNEIKKKRDDWIEAKNSMIRRQKAVEARRESLEVIDHIICRFE